MRTDYGIIYKGNNISIPDLIENLIDNIRDTYTISAITHIGDVYTVNTSKTKGLVVGDYVTIGIFTNLLITELTTNVSFKVTSTVNITGSSWKAQKPYSYYGHPVEIATVISEKNNSSLYKLQKFPAFCLFLNIPEERNYNEIPYTEVELLIAIVTYTNPKYKATDRTIYSFTNVLNPLCDLFLNELEKNSQLFIKIDEMVPEITPIYFYGSDKDQNILNELCDAIELKLKLKIILNPKTNCNVI